MMSKGEQQLRVTLVGGGPWGFRLQGGRDHGTPLIVSKIRKKSKAFNNLVEGDIVIGINGKACHSLTLDDIMALVDNARGDLTLEIVRGADPKDNEEKKNVAPSEASPNLPEGEKKNEVVVVLQNQQLPETKATPTVVQEDQSQVSFTLPVKKIPPPFQQAPIAQVALPQPAVILQTELQVSLQSISHPQQSSSPQQVSEQQEVPQSETEHNISVAEVPTPQSLPSQEGSSPLTSNKDLLVSHPPIQLSSQESGDKAQIQQDKSKSVDISIQQTLHTVETQKIVESEFHSVQSTLDPQLSGSQQTESIQETITVSELSSVQQAPLISQQIPVQNAPSAELTVTHPIVNNILVDKEPGIVSVTISPQDISQSTDSASVIVVPVEKKKRLIASSAIVSESTILTPSLSSEPVISVSQTPAVQDILTEAEQIIISAEKEALKTSESKKTVSKISTTVVVESSQIDPVKEVILKQPSATEPSLPTILPQEESVVINTTSQEVATSLINQDSEVKASVQIPLVLDTCKETKSESVSIKQEVPLPAQKPEPATPLQIVQTPPAEIIVEKVPVPVKQPLRVNFTVETSVSETTVIQAPSQDTVVTIKQPEKQVSLPQTQVVPTAPKLTPQQSIHQAPPLQHSTPPFQQVPIQQTPSPQQALLTNMGQGESKKESQPPPSQPSVESQQPLRPLPQLENVPPPPAHLLEPCSEPPFKVQYDLPLQEKETFLPQTCKPTPELQSHKPIPPPTSLPSHIQDNIPEIPKHLLESNDSQPVLHAKSLKEIHEREIQRVAQEKTANESTSRMLQEFEELRSMQMRGEISEPTAFGMRKQIDTSLVNGHISSPPIHEKQEFISPDNSSRRWITRDKINEGSCTEERFTDTIHHQKGNVQMTQSSSHYKMSDSYIHPMSPQISTTSAKSVVWPPPPPSSPTMQSQKPSLWQPSVIPTTPIIQDYTWQPLVSNTTDTSSSVWKPYETSNKPPENILNQTNWQPTSPMTSLEMDDPLKILQEPHEPVSVLKKRFENLEFKDNEKIYSSSSFYSEANELFPTVEEQIQSARNIADSLYDDVNKKSRGATMFDKRKEEEFTDFRNKQREGVTSPLKLFMDPRSVKDAQALRYAQDTVYHNIVSPDVCHDLVKDLNSPKGKGASMFAKRRLKSEDWVVEDKNVPFTQQVSRPPVAPTNYQRTTQATPRKPTQPTQTAQPKQQTTPDKIISDLMNNPRIKLVKSPWEAALESPIGSCDSAFEEYKLKPLGTAGNIVDTIRDAAEKRELPGPPESWKTTSTKFSYVSPSITPSAPRPLPKFSGESPLLSQPDIQSYKPKFDAKSTQRPFSPTLDVPNYNRAARGWTPVRTFESQETSQTSGFQSPLSTATSETIRPTVYGDYNQKPRKWVQPGGESLSSFAAEEIEDRALSPGRQLSNYNSLPRSFGSSPKPSPGKLSSNVWPYESREEYSSEYKSYQAPRSRQQLGGYSEEVGYTDL